MGTMENPLVRVYHSFHRLYAMENSKEFPTAIYKRYGVVGEGGFF